MVLAVSFAYINPSTLDYLALAAAGRFLSRGVLVHAHLLKEVHLEGSCGPDPRLVEHLTGDIINA